MEKTDYTKIMRLFDPDGENPLGEFCRVLVREDETEEAGKLREWRESPEKEVPKEIDGAIFWQECVHMFMGFAVGYVIGQDYDIGDKELSGIVKDLRERILKAKALPYFQRREKEEPQAAGKQN